MDIAEFERQVMTALLAGDDPILDALRQQYAVATVRGREKTTSGFVTRFDVPAGAAPIERKLLHLDDLQMELAGTTTPVDASLHIHNGRLRSLECYVYEGTFPESPTIAAAWYYGTEKFAGITPELIALRDLDDLLEDE